MDLIEKNRIQYFYDRLFMSRIGIRTLVYHHSIHHILLGLVFNIWWYLALLFGDELPQHSQQAGVIDPCVDVAAVVRGKD